MARSQDTWFIRTTLQSVFLWPPTTATISCSMRDLRKDSENCGYSTKQQQECGEMLFYGVVHARSRTFGITCCTAVCVDIESNGKGNVIRGFRHTSNLAPVFHWPHLKEVSSGLHPKWLDDLDSSPFKLRCKSDFPIAMAVHNRIFH